MIARAFGLAEFVGLAMVYATLATAAFLALAAAVGRFPGWRAVPFLLLTLTFLFMTQHPFPDPAKLVCPVPSATPRLEPFNFWFTVETIRARGEPWYEYFANVNLLAAAMNYILCVFIGMALANHTARLSIAVAFGLGMTLLVEFTQLTGIWGLFPCAYRQFNVDDLILNSLGVVSGFLLARYWQRRGRTVGREGGLG